MSIIDLGLLVAVMSAAVPTASAEQAGHPPTITLTNAQGENARWSGIGRLSLPDYRQCIATLIDTTGGRHVPENPLYAVTSGHCIDQRHGVIVRDGSIDAKVTFNYFVDTPDQRWTLPVKHVLWSSMQGTDLALLQLDGTQGQALEANITPVPMGHPPAPGSTVQVIGESSEPDQGLRLSRCEDQQEKVAVVYPWVWRNARRNDCEGMAEGASGSPVIEPASGRLVGIVNSTAQERQGNVTCSLEHPCQADGQPLPAPRNFAMPVSRLLGCFTQGRADLSQDGCELLPGFQLQQQIAPWAISKIASATDGRQILPTWGLTFTLDTPRYRYKTTRDALACEDPSGYSGTIPASQNRIDDPVGPEPGWHYLCLIGVDGPEQQPSPGLMANSLSIPLLLLPEGLPIPTLTTVYTEDGDVDVTWHLAPPNLTLYRVKRGAPDQIDCNDPSGYRAMPRTQHRIPATQLPMKLCTKAYDLLKQSSPARMDLLEPRSG
ncbi:serine protease [Pseudomonas sichuanensis]|uniref:trypsin-like peptidase domain-containing protein n=1 Tax=Pseudomonas sichuanensis TaxID=2213015 RepID=UPI002447D1E3|nr:serine protease [Pseudomonas sichuanensis]MDH0733446.1 serine protease [Pseudomonas sichuanensis]MDH1582097.1 serine protease [Pseudomonas sichuanensis]MDH1594126.1 serine protease [Pseudomonas sichuanensis]MDH1596530.1 serine protease [Pseudomonas sichuanensis]